MIKVCVQVHEGPAPITLMVWAESITRAVGLIEERHPGRNVRVVFPIDPEEFFVSKETGQNEREGRLPLDDPVMRVR